MEKPCLSCGALIEPRWTGRPALYCSVPCRRVAEYAVRRATRRARWQDIRFVTFADIELQEVRWDFVAVTCDPCARTGGRSRIFLPLLGDVSAVFLSEVEDGGCFACARPGVGRGACSPGKCLGKRAGPCRTRFCPSADDVGLLSAAVYCRLNFRSGILSGVPRSVRRPRRARRS